MIKGIIAVDIGCGWFMTDHDGARCLTGQEFWVCLEGMGLVGVGYVVLMIRGDRSPAKMYDTTRIFRSDDAYARSIF
jgi:hypothetical protein